MPANTDQRWHRIVGLLLLAAFVVGVPATGLADNAEDAYLLAAGFYKKERWDQASAGFQKFIKDYPKHPRIPTARFFLGLSQVNEGEYKAARDNLKLFVQEAPTSRNVGHATYRIAECSYLLDDLPRAEPELAEFVTKYKDDPLVERALPYLADVQLRTNKVDQALKSFQEAMQKFPAGPMLEDCEFGVAKCYEAKQQLDQAIAIYAKLAAQTGNDRAPEAQLNLGSRYYDLEQYDKAAAAFEKFEQTFPKSPLLSVARLNHGFSLFETNQFEKASEQFVIAGKDPQQAPVAGYWQAQCLSSLGKYPAAAELLKGLYAKYHDHEFAEKLLFTEAEAEQHQGHFADAQKLFLELVGRFPPTSERADDALHLATQCAFDAGNTADAEKLLAQFNQTFPNSPLRWDEQLLAGRLQILKGQAAASLPIFDKILKEEAAEPVKNWARYYIGFAQLELGQPIDALQATESLAQVVDKDPKLAAFAAVFLIRGAAQLTMANREPVANTQRDMYAAAASSASLFLSKQPQAKEADQALSIRALASAHSGLKDRAKGDIELLVKDYANSPGVPKALYEIAEVAYSNEDWEWSTQLFTALAAKGKESKYYLPAMMGHAWSVFKQKQYDMSGKLFAQVVTEFSDGKDAPEASFMQGKSLQNGSQVAAAVPVFDSTLQKYPTSKFAYLAGLEAARIRRDTMQYAEADKAFAAVLEKFPMPEHLDKILHEWAMSNYEGKEYARSDAVFERLLKDVPASDLADNARLSLAESDLVSGKLDVAKQKFQELEKDPKSDETVQQVALYQLIQVNAEQHNWAEIRRYSDALNTRFPQSKYHWLAEFHGAEADLNLMDVTKAIPRLKAIVAQKGDAAIANEPWFGEAWKLLAEAQLRDKQHDEVAKTVAECRQWNPDFPLQYLLDEIAARSLKAQAKFPEAIKLFQQVVNDPFGAKTETAAKAQFMIAECYLFMKDLKQADTAYLTVVIKYKFPEWQAAALYGAGVCEQDMKNWKDAAKSFSELIRDYPMFDRVKNNEVAGRLKTVKENLAMSK